MYYVATRGVDWFVPSPKCFESTPSPRNREFGEGGGLSTPNPNPFKAKDTNWKTNVKVLLTNPLLFSRLIGKVFVLGTRTHALRTQKRDLSCFFGETIHRTTSHSPSPSQCLVQAQKWSFGQICSQRWVTTTNFGSTHPPKLPLTNPEGPFQPLTLN